MASIVKVPKNATADYDFVAFSFDGKHSYEDMGIIRTSGGDRFTMDLAPTMQDKTVEVPGGHGTQYFGTEFKKRDFRISFAFDDLTETKLAELKHWLKADKISLFHSFLFQKMLFFHKEIFIALIVDFLSSVLLYTFQWLPE